MVLLAPKRPQQISNNFPEYFFFFFLIFVFYEKTKPQSKEENIVKIEDKSILSEFKDECENNFMESKDEEIHIVTKSPKIHKRKRKQYSIVNDTI